MELFAEWPVRVEERIARLEDQMQQLTTRDAQTTANARSVQNGGAQIKEETENPKRDASQEAEDVGSLQANEIAKLRAELAEKSRTIIQLEGENRRLARERQAAYADDAFLYKKFLKRKLKVKEIEGIKEADLNKLGTVGCRHSSAVFAVFLLLEKNEEKFTNWMDDNTGMDINVAKTLYNWAKLVADNVVASTRDNVPGISPI